MIGIRIPQGLLSAGKNHQKTGNETSEYWTWPANLVVVPLSFWAQGEHQSKPVAREIQEPGSLRHLISYSQPLRRMIRTSANQRTWWHGKTTIVWSCRRVSHIRSTNISFSGKWFFQSEKSPKLPLGWYGFRKPRRFMSNTISGYVLPICCPYVAHIPTQVSNGQIIPWWISITGAPPVVVRVICGWLWSPPHFVHLEDLKPLPNGWLHYYKEGRKPPKLVF